MKIYPHLYSDYFNLQTVSKRFAVDPEVAAFYCNYMLGMVPLPRHLFRSEKEQLQLGNEIFDWQASVSRRTGAVTNTWDDLASFNSDLTEKGRPLFRILSFNEDRSKESVTIEIRPMCADHLFIKTNIELIRGIFSTSAFQRLKLGEVSVTKKYEWVFSQYSLNQFLMPPVSKFSSPPNRKCSGRRPRLIFVPFETNPRRH